MCTEYMKGSFHMTTKPIMLSKKLYLLGKSFTEFQSSLVHLIKKIPKSLHDDINARFQKGVSE